jgi:bifunctional DNase/RNase
MAEEEMVDMVLGRIVIRDGTDRQFIFLQESGGKRGFPIVIGANEADEIRRVVHQVETPRPLTHQLAHSTLQALGATLESVDIVDLRENTYFAHLVLRKSDGNDELTVVDARPSDAIALAMRARCQIRVTETVLERANVENEEGPAEEP